MLHVALIVLATSELFYLLIIYKREDIALQDKQHVIMTTDGVLKADTQLKLKDNWNRSKHFLRHILHLIHRYPAHAFSLYVFVLTLRIVDRPGHYNTGQAETETVTKVKKRT